MTLLEPPALTVGQRDHALALANEVRFARARVKADIREGRRSACSVLEQPVAAELASMKVLALLQAIRYVGDVRAQAMLREAGCSVVKTLGGLTDRQRQVLTGLVADEEARRPQPARVVEPSPKDTWKPDGEEERPF